MGWRLRPYLSFPFTLLSPFPFPFPFLVLVFFLFTFMGLSPSHSAMPPDVQAYFNGLPGKKLTLPFVIQQALAQAQAYRLLAYDYETAGLEELGRVESLTDTLFTVGGTYMDDNSVKDSLFQPLRTQRDEWSFGLSKNWGTGTTTSLSWLQDNNRRQLAPGTENFGLLANFRQSRGILKLEQSLLKDSFGYAFRLKKRASQARGKSIQWKVRDEVENLTLQFINQYYQSWLLKEQAKSVEAQIKRQRRLVGVMTKRSKKGVVEKPDLIQTEALLSSSQTNLSKIRYELSKKMGGNGDGLGFTRNFLGC